jgi:transcriptional regulator with XRE-family HTH domain
MKQEAMAELLNVSQAFISRLESGHAEPRDELRARILELLDNPANRSVFDHVIAHVKRSPDALAVVRPAQDELEIVAVSEGFMQDEELMAFQQGAFETQKNEARIYSLIREALSSGVFDGHIEYVEAIWVGGFSDEEPVYRRGVATPLRGDDGAWYLHCSLVRLSKEEYLALSASRDNEFIAKPFE